MIQGYFTDLFKYKKLYLAGHIYTSDDHFEAISACICFGETRLPNTCKTLYLAWNEQDMEQRLAKFRTGWS